MAARRAVVVVLAVGAFAFGATAGSGEPQPSPSAASRLSAAQLAGQRIVVGFDGPRPPKPVRRMIRAGRVAGVVLFADNLPDRAATRRLTAELQAIPRPPGLRAPLLVMTDQEGGLVKRLAGPPSVSAYAMGARGTPFSRAQGLATGRSLLEVGINVDLAPVLDVARPGGAIARTARGFGSSPGRVAATAVPFASGLQAAGVAATAKHFPGFGAGLLNTDSAVERIELPVSALREVDEAPYKHFIAAGGELVMLSTAIYPALSVSPAAFSREIATGELRDRLGFEGVAITDALETVAVRDFGGPVKAALAATRAGVDLLLFTDHRAATRAWGALLGGLRSGAMGRADFELSAGRVLRLRHRLDRP